MKTPPCLRDAQTRLHDLARRITGLLYRIDELGKTRRLDRRELRAVLDAEIFFMRARSRLEAHGSFITNAWRSGAFSAREATRRLDALVDEVLEELGAVEALPLLEPHKPEDLH